MIADIYIHEKYLDQLAMPLKIKKYNKKYGIDINGYASVLKIHGNPGFKKLIEDTDNIEDLKYLKNDLRIAIRNIEKIKTRISKCKELGECKETKIYYNGINKMYISKGITEEDCDLTTKEFYQYIQLITEKISTIRKSMRESSDIINEAFVGKQSIEKLHSIFCTMRNEGLEKRKQPSNNRIKEFETEIENFFGFKAFDFDIDPSMSLNAFTYPVTTSWDFSGSEYIETTKNGYRFKKSYGLVAISRITRGLFYNKNITNDECFAIFLHEIGHSFVNRSELMESTEAAVRNLALYSAIIRALLELSPLPMMSTAYDIITNMNWFKTITVEVNKILKNMKIMRKFNWTIDSLISAISSIIIKTVNTTIKTFGGGLITNKLNLFLSKYLPVATPDRGRASERLSDDFAKVYGYGTELSSGLLKLNIESYDLYDSKIIKKIPIIKKWFDYQDDIAEQCIDKFDVHPSNTDRILSIRKAMEDDLKSADISPKVKKELKENLNAMDELIDDLKKSKGIMEKDPNTYRQARIRLQACTGLKLTPDEKEYMNSDYMNKDFNDRMIKEYTDLQLEDCIDTLGSSYDFE